MLAQTVAGMRTIPIDVEAERRSRAVELRADLAEIDRRIRSVGRSRALTEPMKRARLAELRRQRREILETFQREGVVP